MKKMWQAILKMHKAMNKIADAPVEISVANRHDLDRPELRSHIYFRKF